jgi:hypothetical protein
VEQPHGPAPNQHNLREDQSDDEMEEAWRRGGASSEASDQYTRKLREIHKVDTNDPDECRAMNHTTLKAVRRLRGTNDATRRQQLENWRKRCDAFDGKQVADEDLYDKELEELMRDDSDDEEPPTSVFLVRLLQIPLGLAPEDVMQEFGDFGPISKEPAVYGARRAAEIGYATETAAIAATKYKGKLAEAVVRVHPENSLALKHDQASLHCTLRGRAQEVNSDALIGCFDKVRPSRVWIERRMPNREPFAWLYFESVQEAETCLKLHKWVKVEGIVCKLAPPLNATTDDRFTVVLQGLPLPGDRDSQNKLINWNDQKLRKFLRNVVGLEKEAILMTTVETNRDGQDIGKARVLIRGRTQAKLVPSTLSFIYKRLIYACLPARRLIK